MWSPLDHLERFVMLKKGTETPFTGKYNLHFEKGVYRCKQCHKPLFESDSKFDSQDGWPAFDEVIPGSVLEQKTQPTNKPKYRVSIVKVIWVTLKMAQHLLKKTHTIPSIRQHSILWQTKIQQADF